MRIAINGCGRIGRTAFKTIISQRDWGRVRLNHRLDRDELEVVALNDLGGLTEDLAYLFKYDSAYGTYPGDVAADVDAQKLIVDGFEYPFFAEKDPSLLPWGELGVDVVLECTGAFTQFEKARAHITAGAKKVVISANGKGDGPTLVAGTQSMAQLDNMSARPEYYEVVSAGSCTTNCTAPIMQLLQDKYAVEKAQLITVHAVTSTQNLVDGISKNKRRSRAAYGSIIPQSTGAAVAVTKVVPGLEGKFNGMAFRVPVMSGSVIEIVAQLGKSTTVDKLNNLFTDAAENELKGVIEVTSEELVSTDIVGYPTSTLVDLPLTEVIADDLVKIVAWYDNEYGYVCRLVELAQTLFSL